MTEPAPAPSDLGRVSVVIPHYGDPSLVRDLVSDLREQVGDGSLQVIVVDDASPTPFPEEPDVTVVRRSHNGGFGSAVNAGAAVATGDFLLIANSDLRVGPDVVRTLVRIAERLGAAVLSPRVVLMDGEPEPDGRRFPSLVATFVESLYALRRFGHRGWYRRLTGWMLPRGTEPEKVDWLHGACLFLRRADFAAVAGFDERFFMYSEEVDLQRRLRQAGVASFLVPSITVRHAGGASTGSPEAHEWMVRSRHTYAAKWGHVDRERRILRVAAYVNFVARSVAVVLGVPAAPRVALRRELMLASLPEWPADGRRDVPPAVASPGRLPGADTPERSRIP